MTTEDRLTAEERLALALFEDKERLPRQNVQDRVGADAIVQLENREMLKSVRDKNVTYLYPNGRIWVDAVTSNRTALARAKEIADRD